VATELSGDTDGMRLVVAPLDDGLVPPSDVPADVLVDGAVPDLCPSMYSIIDGDEGAGVVL
jgi:hypothetical protein